MIKFYKFSIILGFVFSFSAQVSAKTNDIAVYASKSCGCCHKWVKHLESNGFKVKTILVDEVYKIKEKYKIPDHLQSCHTGVIDGYIVEGHVPAKAVRKLIIDRPKIKGISVPGMPMGSPGMEQGNEKEAYNVIGFSDKGKETVFMKF